MIDQAIALHHAGRVVEAIDAYRELLRYRPEDARLLTLYGLALAQGGRTDEAAAAFGKASRLEPGQPSHYRNLAVALADSGQADLAAKAWIDLAALHDKQGNYADALEACDRALALAPHHRDYRSSRCAMLNRLGRVDEAIAEWHALPVSDDAEVEHLNELGRMQLEAGRTAAAIASFRAALALDPDYPQALTNLGTALLQLQIESGDQAADEKMASEAIACYRRALAVRPDMPIIHWNLALALLARGDFAAGFAAYEWRLRREEFSEPPRRFPTDTWHGAKPERLNGILLITAEQGLGDAIQFARYLPMLAAMGHRVVVEVPRPLHTLFWSSLAPHGITVVPRMNSPAEIATELPIGAHAFIVSLAQRFGTTLNSIPAHRSYLVAEPSGVETWRRRLADIFDPMGPKIGLVWAGRPQHAKDKHRSMPLDQLRPVWSMPGCHFVSLQKGDAAAQLTKESGIVPLGPALHDLAETAAVIANLDLIIAVDTSVAHLAGALGKPCWLMLPVDADWRWLRHRTDSPWYASIRLYRQKLPGEWSPVIDRVVEDLRQLLSARDY